MSQLALVFDLLLGKDTASPGFLRFSSAANKASASAIKANKSAADFASKSTVAGAKLTKSLTLPLLGAAAVSVDLAAKFQKATSVYVTAAGESNKNLGVVRDGIKKTAVETGTSIDQLTSAEYLLEKAGLRGASGLKLLNAAAKGAREENANLADVVQGATSVMNSYHIGTDKSVQVINALKTAAGSSKATMEDYVKSLSTVIPIAAAAKISLSQVLGGVSTLTQHGTTPAEATQELASTIRQLQAPSNVAVSAMNQLGISAVNVSSNLGKRGLTGTFDYIESKLPKTGLVYLSTMKQMEAGTTDLTAAESKMSPQLAKLSKGFLDGSVSAKDYRDGFKALGATGYAQGSQFLSLATKVKGYNDSIKAGTPAQKTMAAELKAIYGGAIGLNTVLQLGGHNLDGFKARTDAVGKSLSSTAKDVEGWEQTSKLASVQADRFKESIRVLAINLGTTALPKLTSLAHGATGVVTSFQNLSSTDKKVAAWSAGVLVAIGPVLSITGRLTSVGLGLTRFTTGAVNQLGRFNTGVALNADSIAKNMGRVNAAVAGAGIGLAVGTLTANASSAKKAIGVLGSAAAGAAIGFGAGGGLGAAIGGVAGALTAAVTSFHLFSGGAKSAIKPTDDFTSAIQADSDAIGKNTSLLTANVLQKSGAFDAGRKLGLSTQTVLKASLGDSNALQAANSAIIKNAAVNKYVYGGMTAQQKAASNAADKLKASLGDVSETLKVNQHAANNVDSALGKTKGSLSGTAAAAAKTKVSLLDLGNTQVKPGIKVDPTEAKRQIALVQATMNAIKQGKVPTLAANSARAHQVLATLQGEINALRQGHEPSIGVNAGSAIRVIAGVREALDSLHNKTVTVYSNTVKSSSGTRTNADKGPINVANAVGTLAAFGRKTIPPNTRFTVGEGASHTWEGGVTDSMGRASIFSNRDSKAMGFRAPVGYAKGTQKSFTVGNGETTYTSARALANSVNSALRQITSSMLSFTKSLTKSGADIKSAFASVLAHAKAAGFTKTELARLTALDNKAASYADARNKAAASVAALTSSRSQESAAIRGTTRAAFDITSAGASATTGGVSLGGILAQGAQQKAIAAKFTAGLKKLRKEGLQLGVIQQLAEAGPGAWPQVQALLTATPKQLATLNGYESSISTSGKSLGDYVGGQIYNGKITAAQKTANHEAALLRAELKALRAAIVKDEKRSIDVYIDGKKSSTNLKTASNKNSRRK